jgi:hypothetical protein
MAKASSAAVSIHEAYLRADGVVEKGNRISRTQAIALRRAGKDVVVCGTDGEKNRFTAQGIETEANGKAKHCPPHSNAGDHALYHFQPDPRPPEGHTFYEKFSRRSQ